MRAFRFITNLVSLLKSNRSFYFCENFCKSLRYHHLKGKSTYNFKQLKQYAFLLSSASMGFFLYWNSENRIFCQANNVERKNSKFDVYGKYEAAISKCRDIVQQLKRKNKTSDEVELEQIAIESKQILSSFKEYTHRSFTGSVHSSFVRSTQLASNIPALCGKVIISRHTIDEAGCPGIVIGVSVDGKVIWEEGFGYSDIENRVHCSPTTVMRIASISKSITMTAVGKLWEENKLDLDKSVQFYVPNFPRKKYNGEQVDITCRQLLSHLAGIRHYTKDIGKLNSSEDKKAFSNQDKSKRNLLTHIEKESTKEFDHKEYYIKDKYEDIKSALSLFQDDDLISKPGSEFHYSTHGWTLVSAIVEKAANEPFTTYMTKMFKSLGMTNTYLDVNDALIYHRSRYYIKNKQGHLINAPYVDNSYKWAGGGFQSTVGDLLLFGNAMLYSLQFQSEMESVGKNVERGQTATASVVNASYSSAQKIKNSDKKTKPRTSNEVIKLPGFLKAGTVKTMWTPVTPIANTEWMYAMGWFVLPEKQECEYCLIQPFSVAHTGGAIGASSVLLVLPKKCSKKNSIDCQWSLPPRGIIVAILTNLKEVGMKKQAYEIAKIFDAVNF